MTKELLTMDDQPEISPELLEIANTYLMHGMDSAKTALHLDLPVQVVNSTVNSRAVGNYITTIMLEQGFMNRNKLYDTLSRILEKKLEECEESEMYSSKDIIDIIKMMNDMRMKEEELMIKRLEAEAKVNKTKVNVGTVVQVNNPSDSNLGSILSNLVKPRNAAGGTPGSEGRGPGKNHATRRAPITLDQ